MVIDTNTMISITEIDYNFSKIEKIVDEYGMAVIMKNDVPRYLVVDFCGASPKTETCVALGIESMTAPVVNEKEKHETI